MITAFQRSEAFRIGDDVKVRVMQDDAGDVVVGIVTDKDITIENDELDHSCEDTLFNEVDFNFFLFVNQPQTVLPCGGAAD